MMIKTKKRIFKRDRRQRFRNSAWQFFYFIATTFLIAIGLLIAMSYSFR